MDIFSTVVSAIDLAEKIVGYAKAVKGGKQDRLELLSEVSALKSLLQIMSGRLGSGDDISNKLVKAGIKHPLHACYGALQSTVAGLERVMQKSTAKSSSFGGIIRDLKWPFRQEDVKTTLGSIERLKSLIMLALQTSLIDFIEKARDDLAVMGTDVGDIKSIISSLEADQRAYARRMEGALKDLGTELRHAADGIMAIQNVAATIDGNQQEKERRGVLKWLSSPEFDQKHTTAFGKHATGTGAWFLKDPKFVAWRKGEYGVLWCPGNPGVGKSIMTSVIIHDLQEKIAEDEAVVFIYFDYTTSYTAQQLVEGLLSQFVRRGMSSLGMKSLQKHMEGNRPTLEELWAILGAEVGTYSQIFVVIDALDEADGPAWIPLLKRLRALPGIKILATSRNLGNISLEFQNDHRLDIVANDDDLRKYVEGRISDSTGNLKQMLTKNSSLRAEIISRVTAKADGMFLLARLHMNALEAESRVVDLRRALTELPQDLQSAYDATLTRISDKDKPLALHIFSWVIHAARPMTIDDLQYALAVEDGMTAIDTDFLHDKAHLMSVCVGLIVQHEESSLLFEDHVYRSNVGLVHYTTQDHLRNHISAQLPHPAHLAITCIKYLAFDGFNAPLDWHSRSILMYTVPLVEYAVKYLGEHVRMHSDDPTVRRLAMELLHDHKRVSALGLLACGTEGPSAVHLCAHFGLEDYLIDLLDHGSDVNSKDPNGNTALTVAADRGDDGILQLLLTREGVDVNPKGRYGATPLTHAVMQGHKKIVELLLARDDVDANWYDDFGRTPLAYAAGHGRDGFVELLLARNDVDINSQDQAGETPLISAASCGHEAVVRLLLARDDVKINLQDEEGRIPLALAIFWERETIVRLLLARDDLDIGLKTNDGDTHLIMAAHRNNDQIVELLLATGNIDVNSRNLKGRVALSVAALQGHDAVVKSLLAQYGVDVNAADSDGNTPLDLAEGFKYQATAELLQAAGGRKGVKTRDGEPVVDSEYGGGLPAHLMALDLFEG